jgi:hypothetical protein
MAAPPSIYAAGSRGSKIVRAAAISSILAGIATLAFVYFVWSRGPGPEHIYEIYMLAAAWAIGPAVWFWYEYFFVYRQHGDAAAFDEFKHGQQTAIAIWAGVTLSLAAFASSDHFKAPGAETTTCECKCSS